MKTNYAVTEMKVRNILILLNFFFLLSASVEAQKAVEQWNRYEIILNHSTTGNGFNDVVLSAKFIGEDTTYFVKGFYDGNNVYKIRFMPERIGIWKYKTSSNVSELNNKKGYFECIKATGNNHGIVRVSDTYNFKYADGKQYYPFGTTLYAWNHMGQGLQEITLNTLKNSGFNKVRMCVFPKSYGMVEEEPETYPFAIKEVIKDDKGKEKKVWDFDHFNPAYFQHLEKRIDDLNNLGIEADLILFHPYDKGRWGFDAMSNEVNIRYIKYLTARLSSYRNVWWSMANEWNLVKSKTHDDWDLLTKTVVESDPYRHLCSIHGATATYYEYWKPEFTHVSVQDEAPVQFPGGASILRNVYKKPIICDEVGYEGNITARWGRYSPEEMTYMVWMGTAQGTYVTHGETYLNKETKDTIFWAKGGHLQGGSWKRIAFLRKIMEDGPGPLYMSDISRDFRTASAGNGYYLIYFGKEMNDSWMFNLPSRNWNFGPVSPGTRFKVEIIDTWDMTIQECPLIFETSSSIDYRVYDKDMKKVRLPLKPYIALRITEIKN